MFRIQRIHDDVLPANRARLDQVKRILREQFTAVPEREFDALGEKLRNPFKHRFRSLLYVGESHGGRVVGCALVLYDPQLAFFYLDYLAAPKGLTSRGSGGALYQYVREEAKVFGAKGLYMECLPDNPADVKDPAILAQNRARLRFYEYYGARPIADTAYQAPVRPGGSPGPYLVFDGLDCTHPLRRAVARRVVRAILEGRYSHLCTPEYVRAVVGSIKDDPVKLREFLYVTRAALARQVGPVGHRGHIPLVINDRHQIHHVHERGYVEAPVRIGRILSELDRSGLFERVKPREYSLKPIRAVHDADFTEYLRRVCSQLPAAKSIYPYVFPIRNVARPPKELPVRAGYFCIDTFTPLNRNAYLAAKRAVDCTLTAAELLLEGRRLAYALVRPPGHHAERRFFGGFCYFNNNAVAAQRLSAEGKVAILDIDYHHGNGQQSIFYERADVLTLSIHGHPNFAYPYFSGFEDERGAGAGEGFNLNIPLPETAGGERYRKALDRALKAVRAFRPAFLVVPLGLDTARGDPTGTWSLSAQDFEENGRRIGALDLPTLVVQEGGYRTRTLGINARRFFEGLFKGAR